MGLQLTTPFNDGWLRGVVRSSGFYFLGVSPGAEHLSSGDLGCLFFQVRGGSLLPSICCLPAMCGSDQTSPRIPGGTAVPLGFVLCRARGGTEPSGRVSAPCSSRKTWGASLLGGPAPCLPKAAVPSPAAGRCHKDVNESRRGARGELASQKV